jgi:hypothetical protein
MAAQPQIVQIKSSTSDLAATGVHLVPLDDIGHTATVEAILGEDRPMVAPILRYGVLVVNGSSKHLTAFGVGFMGLSADGQKRRLIITTSAFPSATALKAFPPDIAPLVKGAISPIAPGASLLFTPESWVNQYLNLPPGKRQSFLGATSGGYVRSGVLIPGNDFPSFIKQRMSILPIFGGGPGDFQAYLEGVAFDDDSYAGSQMMLDGLKRDRPGLHR